MSTQPQAGADAIAQLADTIIETAGADQLPEEAKQPFRENLEAQIMRRLGIIIMEHLDETGVAEYEKLLSKSAKPTPKDLQAFLEEYLPDYEEKIKTGMQAFLQDVSSAMERDDATA